MTVSYPPMLDMAISFKSNGFIHVPIYMCQAHTDYLYDRLFQRKSLMFRYSFMTVLGISFSHIFARTVNESVQRYLGVFDSIL